MMTRTVAMFLAVGGLCMAIAGCDEPLSQTPSTTRQAGKGRTYQDITLDVLAAIAEKDAGKLAALSDSQTEFYNGYDPDNSIGGGRKELLKTTPEEFLNSIRWPPTIEKDRTRYKEQTGRAEAVARGYDGARAIEVRIFYVPSPDGGWRISQVFLTRPQ